MVSIYLFLYINIQLHRSPRIREYYRYNMFCHLHEKSTNGLYIEKSYSICATSEESIILTIHHDISIHTIQNTLLIYHYYNPIKWWKLMVHRPCGSAFEVHYHHLKWYVTAYMYKRFILWRP